MLKSYYLQVLPKRFEDFKNDFKIFENRFLVLEKSAQNWHILGSDFQYSPRSSALLTYINVKYIFWRTQNRWKPDCKRLRTSIFGHFKKIENPDFPSFLAATQLLLCYAAVLLLQRGDASCWNELFWGHDFWYSLWFTTLLTYVIVKYIF